MIILFFQCFIFIYIFSTIIGLVSDHKFSFYPPVQMKTERAAVQIDNVVVKAEFKRKRDYMCWFIDVLDFINEP